MNAKLVNFAAAAALLLGGTFLTAQTPVKDPAKRILGGGTVSILTETLCEDVEGYMGPTPLDIRIKKDTIVDIIALTNEETPAYFAKATKVLEKWIGLTPKEGLELEVDAITGATFSSDALIANVKAGLKKALEKPKED
ncbi:MAG: FMN-binding protein [Bacteroidales bacterium]|nr:FMN-binding protein [Bacteroidales bacterium]